MYLDLQTALYNKRKILAGLKSAQVGKLTLTFWGSEDSGELDDFTFYDLNGNKLASAPTKLKEASILFFRKPMSQAKPSIESHGLALCLFTYRYILDQHHAGWAMGSKGAVEFDTLADLITCRLKKKRAKKTKVFVF